MVSELNKVHHVDKPEIRTIVEGATYDIKKKVDMGSLVDEKSDRMSVNCDFDGKIVRRARLDGVPWQCIMM